VALRLGSRGSALALAQAESVAERLGDAEVVPVRTAAGERGDKGRFVRGVERALLDDQVDLGVHSAKDLPSDVPEELRIVGVPAREDAADAYIGEAESLADVPEGAKVGTSSLRRRAQLLAARPDLEIVELRGNVDTRLKRLGEGEVDGLILAAAGLRRLGREREIAFRLSPEEMTPAAGQGALALEARSDDSETAERAIDISDPASLTELTAERTVVASLDASCATPLGVRAELRDAELSASAFVGLPDGSEWVRDQVSGDPEEPAVLGALLAARLISAGGGEILTRATAAEAEA
jgi:hydroxymethylbilane synthase